VTPTELASPAAVGRHLLAAGDPDRVALVAADTSVTYGELRDRVAARVDELELPPRSLVVLTGSTSLEYVVSYVSLLAAGHVPLPAGSHVDQLVDRWRPAAVITADSCGTHIDRRAGRSGVDVDGPPLHDDLALLLSTSGSTGSPKLVRLSSRNVTSNASAIAEYLGITSDDRGITTLPLHYCYGLSVLHSHLAAGASVVLTEASVVDPCFESAMREHGVTNVAGVPHTFELLDRAGADRLHVPTLRFVTQAGGRMRPDRVRQWIDRTERWGVDFYVMYGQTEATARMAYLPPDVARRRPEAVGVAIPGGSISLRAVDGAIEGTGELVYRGPNVMLGYATAHDDLALGATVDELRTGDLARLHSDDGVYEIVGRLARFVKPFGVRIDLDEVESRLAAVWRDVAVAGDDDGLVVSVPGAAPAAVRGAVLEATGLPDGAVIVDDGPIPRTERGKVDHPALLRSARDARDARPVASETADVASLYATVLGRTDVRSDSTFVSLGGDSLSYVECSVRLEELLGRLPADWHLLPVAVLSAGADRSRRPRRGTVLDTTVLLRAIGICAVVATHMRLWFVPGGAHLLLAVAGYNLSRFQLPIEQTADRVRAGVRTIGRVAVPTVLWVAVGMVAGAAYGWGSLALVNNYLGPASHAGDHWHFWFVEVFVHLTLLATLVMAVPVVRRLDRRLPYVLPLGVLAVALVLRMDWAHLDDWYNLRFRTHGVAWFFVLGWLVHRSDTTAKRVVTTLACVLTIPGFFEYAPREWFIATALVALVWARAVRVPGRLVAPVAAVAGASMWIYVTHFTIWPPLDDTLPRDLAYVLTVGAGVAVWLAVSALSRRLRAPARSLAAGNIGSLRMLSATNPGR
jgi:acyl-CoA synthetase (AMP-forming)/AMP-acid ligase II